MSSCHNHSPNFIFFFSDKVQNSFHAVFPHHFTFYCIHFPCRYKHIVSCLFRTEICKPTCFSTFLCQRLRAPFPSGPSLHSHQFPVLFHSTSSLRIFSWKELCRHLPNYALSVTPPRVISPWCKTKNCQFKRCLTLWRLCRKNSLLFFTVLIKDKEIFGTGSVTSH